MERIKEIKRRKIETFGSILITFVVLFMLVLSGPAEALTLGITNLSNSTPSGNTAISFLAKIDVHTSDRVPLQNATVKIKYTNNTIKDSCTFDLNGVNLTACTSFAISKVSSQSNYSASTSGYGYGWNGSDYTNTSFGYGYTGYNGYGYNSFNEDIKTGSSSTTSEFIYNITYTTPSLASNTQFNIDLYTSANDGTTNSIFQTKASTAITVSENTPPTIGSIAISPSIAYKNSTLNCSAIYADEGNKGNVTVAWYNGSSLYSITTILDADKNSMISSTLSTAKQAEGETWNCTVNSTDGNGLAGLPNSTIVTISRLSAEITSCRTSIIYPGDYYLNSDLTSDSPTFHCIQISSMGVNLDCRGNKITNTYGSPGSGVGVLNDLGGNNITNCVINGNWGQGIMLRGGGTFYYNGLISNNTIYGAGAGINDEQFYNLTIANNRINATLVGISLYYVNYSAIYNNSINSEDKGIWLQYSSYYNTIYNNYVNATNDAIIGGDWQNYFNATNTSGTNIIGKEGIGGNYWNNYTGRSRDTDFFGDTSFNISTSNADYLPLVYSSNAVPYTTSVAITPAQAYKNSTLNCSAVYNDADGDIGNASVYWHNGSSLYSAASLINIPNGKVISKTLDAQVQHEGEIWNCSINATDAYNSAGLPNSTAITISNTAPTQPTISSIIPNPAYTTSLLSTTASDSTDADEDTIQYYYQFNDTGDSAILQGWSLTSTFSCNISGCSKGDIIIAYAKAYDGTVYSAVSSPKTRNISNSNSIAENITLTPYTSVYSNSTITGNGQSKDNDGDILTGSYRFRNDTYTTQDFSTENTFTCNPVYCNVNAVIYCDYKSNDGAADSNVLTNWTTIGNRAPSLTGISISPSTAYKNSTLNCSATYYDPDRDTGNITVYWYNGSSLYSASSITNVLNGSLISKNLAAQVQHKGEIWNCSINASDSGSLASAKISITKTIENTLPEVISIAYSPSSDVYKTTIGLNCTITALDIDNDSLTSIYLHYKNGNSTGITTQNITNASFDIGDSLICQGYASEGSANSSIVNTSSVSILDYPAPPSAGVNVGSGGGGGGGRCTTEWKCTEWSECIGGKQNRDCSKIIEKCDARQKPETTRTCTPAAQKETRKVLFDINLKLLNKDINSNGKLGTSIELINLGEPGKVNATLHYSLIDDMGNVAYSNTEVVSVETQKQFLKYFDLPQLKEGSYKLLIDLTYEGQKEPAQAVGEFVVSNKNKGFNLSELFPSSFVVILSVLIGILIFLIFRKVFFSGGFSSY